MATYCVQRGRVRLTRGSCCVITNSVGFWNCRLTPTRKPCPKTAGLFVARNPPAMTWTNAFDAGECTVSVFTSYGDGVNPDFSAVMAKGGSSSFSVVEHNFTVAVSVDGAVSLDGVNIPGGGFAEVHVAPADASMPMRISAIGTDVGVSGTAPVIAVGASDPFHSVSLSLVGETWSPDPCELPSGSIFMGLYGGSPLV